MNIRVLDQKNNVVTEKSFPPGRNRISVGRNPDNDLVLQVPEISGRHMTIEERYGRVYVRDCDSINGVFINRRKIRRGKSSVSDQDVVEAGNLQFRITRSGLSATGESGPAAQTARSGPTRLTQILVVVVSLLVIAAIVKKATSRGGRGAPQAAGGTSPTNLYAQQQAEARKLYQQAQESYFRNNLVEAASLFSKVLELDPANQHAQDFLEEIRFETVGGLVALAFRNLQQSDITAANRNIAKLQSLDPKNEKVVELVRLRDGEQQFEQAKTLYGEGKFADAHAILQRIQIVNDAQRIRWLREVDGRLNFQKQFREADSNLDKGDAGTALAEFDRLAGTSDPADPWRGEIQQKSALAERVRKFENALTGNDYFEAIRQGQWLDSNLNRENYPILTRSVGKRMSALSAQLAPRRAEFEEAAKKAMDQVEAADGDEVKAAALQHEALRNLVIANYLDPSPQRASTMRDLTTKLTQYVRKVYQQGYILAGLGDYAGARSNYERVLQLSSDDNEYHLKAAEQLKRIRTPQAPAE